MISLGKMVPGLEHDRGKERWCFALPFVSSATPVDDISGNKIKSLLTASL